MRLQSTPEQNTIRIPDGTFGTRATLKIMSRLVREFRSHQAIRDQASYIVEGLPSKAFRDEVTALFAFVRDEIRYLGDVNDVETIQTPPTVLESRQGDCDDKATLLSALLQSIGHPTRFVAVGFEEAGVFDHVYVKTLIGNQWVALDATIEPQACDSPPCPGSVGWEPPNPVAVMVENT